MPPGFDQAFPALVTLTNALVNLYETVFFSLLLFNGPQFHYPQKPTKKNFNVFLVQNGSKIQIQSFVPASDRSYYIMWKLEAHFLCRRRGCKTSQLLGYFFVRHHSLEPLQTVFNSGFIENGSFHATLHSSLLPGYDLRFLSRSCLS